MLPPSLRAYLDANRVPYHVLTHEARFTAQETAAVTHLSGRRFAKVVLLEAVDGESPEFLLAALPANEEVDLARLGRAIGRPVELAEESEFGRLCPDYEPGAAPPFSELTHLPMVVDGCLGGAETIGFNGGTHTDLIEMRWEDFERLARPRVVDCGRWPSPPQPTARMP